MDSGLGGWNLWYLAVGAVAGALFGLILETVYGWARGDRQKLRVTLEEKLWDDGCYEVLCIVKNVGGSYVANIRVHFTILNLDVKWFTFESVLTPKPRGLDELEVIFPAYDDDGNVEGAFYAVREDIPGLNVGDAFAAKFFSSEQLDIIGATAHIGKKHWGAKLSFADND